MPGEELDWPMKILIADDDATARFMMSELVDYMGHTVVLACNGVEAVQLFESEAPDIVLMDVMMPELNGFQAAALIRQIPTDRWVPMIFLSALARNRNLAKGLEAGGDDYIEKPVNFSELEIRIRALQRAALLHEKLAEKKRQLEAYFQQAEEDARIGSHIMGRLVSMAGLRDEALQYWTCPMQRFSGDLVAAARTPGGVLHVMLADAAGHGLPAALNVLPLADIFYNMTEAGFALARIIVALDKKIKQLFPLDRFVAATLVAVDTCSREIKIWNGGNPDPLFIGTDGQVTRFEKSRQLPLGLLQDHAGDARPESLPFQPGQLILFSDGLFEAQAADGSFFSAASLYDELASLPAAQRLDFMVHQLRRHLGAQPMRDDVSLILVDVFPSARAAPAPGQAGAPARARTEAAGAGWKAAFTFDARAIRTLDVIPFLTTVVERLEPATGYRRQIFMILSELFNNAIEHGLLRLDSRMKSSQQGFDAYMQARAGALQELDRGSIDVTLEELCLDGEATLRICVRDSGSGFDHAAIRFDAKVAAGQAHGRGIYLVDSLSLSLHYRGAGNEVVSYCRL